MLQYTLVLTIVQIWYAYVPCMLEVLAVIIFGGMDRNCCLKSWRIKVDGSDMILNTEKYI